MKNLMKALMVAGGLFAGASAMANTCDDFAKTIETYNNAMTQKCGEANLAKFLAIRTNMIKSCKSSCTAEYCWAPASAKQDLVQVANSCLSNEKIRVVNEIRRRNGDQPVTSPAVAPPQAPVEMAKQGQISGGGSKGPDGGIGGTGGPTGPTGSAPSPGAGDSHAGGNSVDQFCATSHACYFN